MGILSNTSTFTNTTAWHDTSSEIIAKAAASMQGNPLALREKVGVRAWHRELAKRQGWEQSCWNIC